MVPDAPHGWPSPIAPPSAQTSSSSMPRSSIDGEHHRRERLGDLDGADVVQADPAGGDGRLVQQPPDGRRRAESRQVRPCRRRRRRRRSAGTAGPRRPAADSVVTATAAAPSEMPQELPAVAVPSGPNDGRSRASRSLVIPARGRSSWEMSLHRNDLRVVCAGFAGPEGQRVGACRIVVLALPGHPEQPGQRRRRPRPSRDRGSRPGRTAPGCTAPGPPSRPVASTARARCWPTRRRRRGPARRHRPGPGTAACSDRLQPGSALPVDRHPGHASPRPAASADTLAMLPPGPRQLPMMTSSIGSPSAATCSATAASTGAAVR